MRNARSCVRKEMHTFLKNKTNQNKKSQKIKPHKVFLMKYTGEFYHQCRCGRRKTERKNNKKQKICLISAVDLDAQCI